MRPIKMELCGWGPYKEKQSIDFTQLAQRGLFLITGDTGAGKTTIFDAITYSIFGELSGLVREKNSVRSDFATEDTPTYVELTLQHRGKEYHIYRRPEYLRRKKRQSAAGKNDLIKEKEYALLTMPDNEKVEGSVSVTRKMQEILGMDIRQFRQISMIAQGEFAKLLTASPKEKMQIFRDIFGTAFFERFAGVLRGRSQELYRVLQMYEHKIEEDIDSFDCDEEGWQELTGTEYKVPEKICAYLADREAAEKKEKKRLTKELEQTEKALGQISEACSAVSSMLRHQAEAEQLAQALEQTAPIYKSREALERWLLYMAQELEGRKQLKAAMETVSRAKAKLGQSQTAYQAAEQAADQKKKAFDHALSVYRSTAIGIAAAMLKDGEPCPVCGSMAHPHAAKAASGHLDEQTLERLQKEREAAEKHLTDAYGDALAAKKELEHCMRQQQDCEAALQELERQYEAVRADCGAELIENLTGTEPLTADSLSRVRRSVQEAVAGYQRMDALLAEKRKMVGEELRRLSLHAIEEAAKKEKELLLERDTMQQTKRRLTEALARNYAMLENAARIRRSLAEKLERMQGVKETYGIVKDLDNLTSGNNIKKLVFEQYVLAGYFEEILHAANRRLEHMTAGRFALYRVEEIGDGRSKDNLEIRVLDHYTGRYRSVKTLSGGETFKAALALALGLSDVIQRQSGGISVDCLFVDEGFGALDAQSLEQACQTLRTLVSGECMIGIISHVPQLREQIENQLLVKRTGWGSRICQEHFTDR